MNHLASTLGLTPAIIEDRLRILALTGSDRERLKQSATVIEAQADRFIANLYTRLTHSSATAVWFTRPETLERVKSQQRLYLSELFSATIDWDYVTRRLQIGVAHHRVRLTPRWYIATCSHFVCEHIEPLLSSASSTAEGIERVIVLTKTILFDASLVLDAYGMTLERSMRTGDSDPHIDGSPAPRKDGEDPAGHARRSHGRPPLSRLPMTADDCEERSDFIGIDDTTIRRLHEMEPLVCDAMPEVLQEFYTVFRSWPETASLLPDGVVERLLKQVSSYWMELVKAGFDRPYAASRTRIGIVHEQIGVSPQVYIIGLARQLTGLLRAIARQHPRPALAAASLIRAVFYDVSFIIDAYMDARATSVLRSEGYASQLLACLSVGVAVVDRDFRVRSANPALLRLLGVDAGLVHHMRADDLVPDPRIHEMLERIIASPKHRESIHVTFGGRRLRLSAVQLDSPAASTTSPPLALLVDDLTDLSDVAPQLDENERRLFETVSTIDAVLWEADARNWITTMISTPVLNLTGLRDVHFLGRRHAWLDQIPEPDRARFVEQCASLALDARCTLVHRMHHAGGGTRWVRTHVVRTGRPPESSLLRGVTIDITSSFLEERRRLEAVAQLAGSVAHEFNGVLTVISGSLGLLGNHVGDSASALELQTAATAVERGAGLTRQLQSFAQGVPHHLHPVILNDLLHSLKKTLQNAAGAGAQVTLDPAEDLWQCRIDTAQFQDALLHLVTNARESMPAGGVIRIGTRNLRAQDLAPDPGVKEFADHVEVAIADNGSGMETEIRRRAVEPFFTTKTAAAGLGLSVVHGFVSQTRGHLVIESGVNHGTTVRLRFPRFIPQPPAGAARDPHPSLARKKILIVEDDTSIAAVMQRMLTRLGYLCQITATTADARDVLAATTPDLVICDVMFAGQPAGAQLGHELSRNRPELPILYISGYAKDSLHLTPETRFLAKPFTLEQISTALKNIFR